MKIKVEEIDGEQRVTVACVGEPTSFEAFLMDNIDSAAVWHTLREVIAGEPTDAAVGGGAAPVVRFVRDDDAGNAPCVACGEPGCNYRCHEED